MKRKVVKLGPSTLVVSLPRKWIKKCNVDAGDELDIEERQRSIIVTTEKEDSIERDTLDFTKHDSLIKRILASRYLKGTDEIEVRVNTREKARTVQKRVDEMIGMEVIEQGKERLLIKAMGTGTEDDLDKIMQRVFFLLHTLSEDSLKAMRTGEKDLSYLSDMEENINRFTDYAFRMLNKRGHTNARKTAVIYCTLYLLEEIGDDYKKINKHVEKTKTNYVSLFERIHNFFLTLEKNFRKFSYDNAINLAKERDSIIKEIRTLQEGAKKDELIFLSHAENLTDNIIKVMGQQLNLQ